MLKDSYKDLRELLISTPDDCAIVYCHSKDTCNDIGARLSKDGLSCRGNVSHIYQNSLYVADHVQQFVALAFMLVLFLKPKE